MNISNNNEYDYDIRLEKQQKEKHEEDKCSSDEDLDEAVGRNSKKDQFKLTNLKTNNVGRRKVFP